jgi:hypothetical protein
MNFFTLKFMIIRWYLLFFGSFARHLEEKLSTCGSNLNFRLVSMSDIEFLCLKWVLIRNFNTMDLIKKFEKIQKLHIHIVVVTLKMASCKTMSKKQSERK